MPKRILSDYQPTPILLSVLGNTPKIITETLYGMKKNHEMMPEKIVVVTTSTGKNNIERGNLYGESGYVARFCKDYGLKTIPFSASDVTVIEDKKADNENSHTSLLDDIRTKEDHDALIAHLYDVVYELCFAETSIPVTEYMDEQQLESILAPCIDELRLDPKHGVLPDDSFDDLKPSLMTRRSFTKEIESEFFSYQDSDYFERVEFNTKSKTFNAVFNKYTIHACLAGGRKSMSFLLGYLMSQLGRTHDKLSHVLVEERAEDYSWSNFYYPTPSLEQPVKMPINDGPDAEYVDFSEIQVDLGYVPLIVNSDETRDKVKKARPRGLKKLKQVLATNEKELTSLKLNLSGCNLIINQLEEFPIKLERIEMAVMWFWCDKAVNEPGFRLNRHDNHEYRTEILRKVALLCEINSPEMMRDIEEGKRGNNRNFVKKYEAYRDFHLQSNHMKPFYIMNYLSLYDGEGVDLHKVIGKGIESNQWYTFLENQFRVDFTNQLRNGVIEDKKDAFETFITDRTTIDFDNAFEKVGKGVYAKDLMHTRSKKIKDEVEKKFADSISEQCVAKESGQTLGAESTYIKLWRFKLDKSLITINSLDN